MSGGGFRVSIPSSVRKTIQNIKEITGNHSEEEIYAMLKECSMDPNETTQKLLLQDTFHEVKRKRDKRKENTSIKESAESRWRPNTQARGRGGRMSYSPRYVSHDAGGGKSSASGKESAINQVFERKIAIPPSPTSLEAKNKETTPLTSSVTVVEDGLTTVDSGSTSATHATYLSKGSGVNQPEISSTVDISKLGNASPLPPSVTANKNHTIATGNGETPSQPTSSFGDNFASISPSSSSAVCFSSSDPVLVPSHDSRFPSAVGATILREVGRQRTPDAIEPTESKLAAGTSASKSQGVGKNQFTESSPHFPSGAHGGTSVSRSSSNYNIRSQPVIGPQKVGPNKEWKPKPTNPSPAQGSGTTIAPEVPNVLVEAGGTQSMSTSSVPDLEESTLKVQREFAELHIQDHRHVIIPNHIHVPESERSGLSFGSIDASFGVSINYGNGYESDKSSTALSETSHGVEETMEEQPSSDHDAFATAEEGDYRDHSQSPRHVPENLSSIEGDVASAAAPDYNESKQEVSLPHGGQQYSVVHTLPNYGFGFVPPMLGSQVAPFENSESQARDASRHPSFLPQQPFDPSSYYAQFYRSSADSDGRLSPFPSPGVAPKYNGNMALLSAQTSQSPQEGGNSLVMSTAGPTPLVTQAGGIMQSSIAATQQPLPIFRPPTGLHISHYPPSYIPYGHYISPFYVPPPAIHQFLSSGAFPQQPQAGSMYAAPAAAAATGVKYSLSQFKAGSNAGNSTHIAMPSGYGPYGSSPAGYNPSSASTGGNSTSNEDLAASQFKESNIYIPGQQSEGSGVWITAPGRDISSLPASSFYNLAHQGQHVPFAPQAGHGTFTNVYHHPAQAVTATTVHPLLQQSQTMAGAIEMVGPTAGVYQQPQHAQMNWPNNY